ncbi:hypothetical protein LPJCHP_LPJCHP_01750, partial [Dysosmobacter welbionis]
KGLHRRAVSESGLLRRECRGSDAADQWQLVYHRRCYGNGGHRAGRGRHGRLRVPPLLHRRPPQLHRHHLQLHHHCPGHGPDLPGQNHPGERP